MAEKIQQSTFTYTSARVRQVLQGNLCPDLPAGALGYPRTFDPVSTTTYVDSDDVLHSHTENSRQTQIQSWFEEYLTKLDASDGSLERLDSIYSGILRCNFQVAEQDFDRVVDGACALLSRLPAVPPNPGLQLDLSGLDAGFFIPGSSKTWENLRVVHFVDNNTMRLALNIAIGDWDSWWGPVIVHLLDNMGEIVHLGLQRSLDDNSEKQTLLTIFLWTSLHRTTIIHFHYILERQFADGYNYNLNTGTKLWGKHVFQRLHRAGLNHPEPSKAMCRCAFELLRSDRASVALDFRDFYKRYAEALESQPARCIISDDGTKPCAGDNPYDCMRFKGAKIEDQSAHTQLCTRRCQRMFWSEESFRKGSGARAVCLKETTDETLIYCHASKNTMAVSHVWSHGQGGRPEREHGTGFNRCLHDRYMKIAQQFDCDSYWMDTPCIPQDHELRLEAIQNINRVFKESKLTLVCDRDLMLIDATHPTLEVQERILAALLVCDWNVRAWTLLEAIRGRHNIWVLCKDDKVISFCEALKNVHRNGSMTLANSFLTSQHLVPTFRPQKSIQAELMSSLVEGFLTVEEAAMMLSHRHASRPGDEIVIWSLLIGETVSNNALEFWEHNRRVNTGFLLSSIPRVGQMERSWAPVRPDIPEQEYRKGRDKICFPEDGVGTQTGFVVDDGLDARWLLTDLPDRPASVIGNLLDFFLSLVSPRRWFFTNLRHRYLQHDRWGALLTPANEGIGVTAVILRGASGYPLYVIAGTNDETKKSWSWRGVVQIKDQYASSLPRSARKDIILR